MWSNHLRLKSSSMNDKFRFVWHEYDETIIQHIRELWRGAQWCYWKEIRNTGNNKNEGEVGSIIEGQAIHRVGIGQWRVGGAVSPVSSRGQSEVNSFAAATWPGNVCNWCCVLSVSLSFSLSLALTLSGIILYNFVGDIWH